MVARAIAQIAGPERPFVAVNCAAIPDNLLESELFGHEQGAFTGATRRHLGILAQANGGTLFLDEIGELPLATQVKLLRAIETGEYRTVGGERTLTTRFRVLTATHRNLERLVERRRFRLDLLHRLGSAHVHIPPLRDRREDIPELAEVFLRSFRAANGGAGPERFARGAIELLCAGAWLGNVRELRNVVEAAAAITSDSSIEAEHVAEFLSISAEPGDPGRPMEPQPLGEALLQAERNMIEDAIRRAGGNRQRAATLLGISEASLYRRMARDRCCGSADAEFDSSAPG
jgi:DNA-binding NtrC family response regulator